MAKSTLASNQPKGNIVHRPDGKDPEMGDKTTGIHRRIVYACGHLYAQCRCIGPKLTTTLAEPCPACIKVHEGCEHPIKPPK